MGRGENGGVEYEYLSSFKSDIGHFWYLMVQNTHGPITFLFNVVFRQSLK